MIKVLVQRANKHIERVVISGHSLSDDIGRDLICAGVSSIVIGSLNALEEMTNFNTDLVTIEDGYVEFFADDDETVQLLINAMIWQLKTIEKSYQDYIEIFN